MNEQQSFGVELPPGFTLDRPQDAAPQESFGAELPPGFTLDHPLSWGEVGTQAVRHVPSSAVQFAKDIVQPIIHPVETAKGLYNVGEGTLQAAGAVSGEEKIPYAKAVRDYFVDRYGGLENLKRSIASDPVGIAGDLSVLLTGGEAAAVRAPALLGRGAGIAGTVGRGLEKTGEVAGAAGRAINPLNVPVEAVKAASIPLGRTTGAGSELIRTAARAGFEGGEGARAFREQMRGQASAEGAVDEARDALARMRDERLTAYKAGMATMTDPTVLDIKPILNTALRDTTKMYKGVDIGATRTQAIRKELQEAVLNWATLAPKDYHTVEGLDALKRQVGGIREATQVGTPEYTIANKVYHSVRDTIMNQAPEYAKVMKGFEQASDIINNIERELSLKANANVGTSLRKLQSVLRNNVSTAYGYRRELLDFLTKAGAPHLMERLAGQALRPWEPRGLGKLGHQLAMEAAAAGIGAGVAGVSGALGGAGGLAATMALGSPRAVGEAAYLGGRAVSPLRMAAEALPPAARQAAQSVITARAGRALQHATDVSGTVSPVLREQPSASVVYTANRLAALLPPGQRDDLPRLLASRPTLRGPADDWAKAAAGFNQNRSAANAAKLSLASRNLVHNLSDAGLTVTVNDVLAAATGAAGAPVVQAHAENSQQSDQQQ